MVLLGVLRPQARALVSRVVPRQVFRAAPAAASRALRSPVRVVCSAHNEPRRHGRLYASAAALPETDAGVPHAGAAAKVAEGAADDENAPLTAPEEETRIHMVETVEEARAALEALRRMPSDAFHACDTEVAGLDLSKSPLGQGRVICLSVYSGRDADYGSGPGTALWIDTSDLAVLDVFKPWLEDAGVHKVWHNYGFDRHVLYNHGIDVRGLGGDTMHMARLWDASRKGEAHLLALARCPPPVAPRPLPLPATIPCGTRRARVTQPARHTATRPAGGRSDTRAPRARLQPCPRVLTRTAPPHAAASLALVSLHAATRAHPPVGYSLEALTDELVGRRKVPMKQIFGVPILKKDGTPGLKVELPPVEELQNAPMTRPDWIQCAA
eukprot:784589-Prymnesium_polylepis.1